MKLKILIIISPLVILSSSCKEKKTTEPKVVDETTIKLELVDRGKYMVDVLGCADCHTPKKMGANGPENDMARYLMGFDASEGLPPVPNNVPMGTWVLFKGDLTAAVGPWGTSYAGNLTPHNTGIGTWELTQFIKALREAKYKGLENTRPMMPPMPRHYAYLTDDDIEAIFLYLQTIKPIENVVPGYQPPNS